MTVEQMDNLEMQSDVFRSIYFRMRELDLRDCQRDGLEPLTHAQLCQSVRERLESMY